MLIFIIVLSVFIVCLAIYFKTSSAGSHSTKRYDKYNKHYTHNKNKKHNENNKYDEYDEHDKRKTYDEYAKRNTCNEYDDYKKNKKYKKYDKFILENSVCLKKLDEINERYHFSTGENLNQEHTYDNEIFYDTISCEDYLIYQLQFIKKSIYSQINVLNTNKRQYPKYFSEVQTITDFGQFEAPLGNLKLDILTEREKLLFENRIIPVPNTQFLLTVTLFCSTINRSIIDEKSQGFSTDDVLKLLERLAKKNGTFYNDREIWDAICRVERGKVSNKMRFSIYARDGYRCCVCGVSNRYAQLEIDHIIPISKGGKSTYDNLQTLCHDCNVQKGDSI